MGIVLKLYTIMVDGKPAGSVKASTHERALHEAKRRHKGKSVSVHRVD